MKKIVIVLLLVLSACFYTYAQTIPFGFKNFKIKRLVIAKVEKKGDKVVIVSETIPQDSAAYEKLYAQQLEVVEKKKIAIAKSIKEKYDALGPVMLASDIPLYNAKIDAINADGNAGYKEVELLNKQAKKFLYLIRMSNKFVFFPARNAVDAELYYNGRITDKSSTFLNNSLLSFSSDGGRASIYNEFYADYIGAVRIGFGALISNKQSANTDLPSNESKQDAVQRLLGGGGNGVFNISYPFVNYEVLDKVSVKMILAPRIAIDVPKIGTNSNAYAFSYSPGVEGSIFYTGALNVLTFYANFRFSKTGGNSLFFRNLLRADESAFYFNQLSAGVAITTNFRLGYNYYFGSSFVKDNFPGSISFVIVPN